MSETPERVKAAKDAVRMFWSHRACLPDTAETVEALDAIRATARAAKAEGRKLTDDEWVELAESVDEACREDGLPLLFDA